MDISVIPKKIAQFLGLYHPIRDRLRQSRDKSDLVDWQKRGKPVPPPHIVKQQAILDVSKRYHCDTLVETGTYFGDMVESMKSKFAKIHTIELDDKLFAAAEKRFRNDENVTLYHGDSGVVIDAVLSQLNATQGRALFWLDGHYSGEGTADSECPIVNEVRKILEARENDIILIDDAHCFGSMTDYPSIEELRTLILNLSANLKFEINDNMILLLPK